MRCCSSDPQPTSLLCVDFEAVGQAATTGHVPNVGEDQAGSELATFNLDLRISHMPFAGGKLIADAWWLEHGVQFLPIARPDALAMKRGLLLLGVIGERFVHGCYPQGQMRASQNDIWLGRVLGSAKRTGNRIVAAGA